MVVVQITRKHYRENGKPYYTAILSQGPDLKTVMSMVNIVRDRREKARIDGTMTSCRVWSRSMAKYIMKESPFIKKRKRRGA